MVAKIAGPGQGEEPVTINEETTRSPPLGSRAVVDLAATLLRVLRRDNATMETLGMAIISKRERGEVEVEGEKEVTLGGGDTTGTVLGGEGVGEDGSTARYPSPAMVGHKRWLSCCV